MHPASLARSRAKQVPRREALTSGKMKDLGICRDSQELNQDQQGEALKHLEDEECIP
jgi:hypothetical protein